MEGAFGLLSWLGRALFGLVACLLIGGVFVYARSETIFRREFIVPKAELRLDDSGVAPDRVRGQRIAGVIAQCHFCHGNDLAGSMIADDPLIGRLDAPNLTRGRGGLPGDYERDDWVRAIRFGVGREGRSLLLMPSAHLSQMTDRDLLDLIAFMDSLPRVDRVRPPMRIGWVARLAVALNRAPGLLSAVEAESTQRNRSGRRKKMAVDSVAYGEYLVSLSNCRLCHHDDLRGGLHPLALPGEPIPPDLTRTGRSSGWTLAEFASAMRSGQTPEGESLDREYMPWPFFAGLEDAEVEAIWLYLRADGGEARVAGEGRSAGGTR